MSLSKHIDMNEEIQQIIRERSYLQQRRWRSSIFSAPPEEKNRVAEEAMNRCGRENSLVRAAKRVPEGQRQVEALLRFPIDRVTQRAMEDAEADNIVYDQLGEHRILGKKKKNKKKKRGY
jgi:hypothetical protein